MIFDSVVGGQGIDFGSLQNAQLEEQNVRVPSAILVLS
jgi:hypothetical protein